MSRHGEGAPQVDRDDGVHSSSYIFAIIRSRRMPALFATTCRVPKRLDRSIDDRLAPSLSVT
jgi:hypothetical protein